MSVFQILPRPELVCGAGALQRAVAWVEKRGFSNLLVVMSPGVERDLFHERMGPLFEASKDVQVRIFDEVEPDPGIDLVERGTARARDMEAQLIIAFGGGSSIDTAKAIAALAPIQGEVDDIIGEDRVGEKVLPLIAVPTTAGTGSEVTHIAILSDPRQELKKGITSPRIIPDLAVLDPELTTAMPATLTANTGLDALSHAVEAFTSKWANSFTDSFASLAIQMIVKALPLAHKDGGDRQAREDMLLASHFAGIAFCNAGVTAAHAFAYPLGARYHIPHGASVIAMLPAVLEYNSSASPEKFIKLAHLMGAAPSVEDPLEAVVLLNRLCQELDMADNLQSFGVPQELLPQFSDGALTVQRLLRNNPRTIENREQALSIYERAYNYDRSRPPARL